MVIGVTHAVFSNTIKIFEFTGQINNLLPSLVANTASYMVASTLQKSLYTLLIEIKQLPLLPQMLKSSLFDKSAKYIMDRDPPFLLTNSVLSEVGSVLRQAEGNRSESVAVLEKSKHLVGIIETANLKEYLVNRFQEYKDENSSEEDIEVPDENNQ